MLLLEIMSHTLYFSSITRYSLWQLYGAQLKLTAVDMGIISFWVLMFMWLKVSLHVTAALPALLQQFCVMHVCFKCFSPDGNQHTQLS